MAKHKKNKIFTFRNILIYLFTTCFIVGASVFLAFVIIMKGPSLYARDLLVNSFWETNHFRFVDYIFFSHDEIQTILTKNAIISPTDVTNSNTTFNIDEEKKDLIDIIDINGSTFQGKLMIVYDPSRVQIATLDHFGNNVEGIVVEDFVKNENAIGGINASGFQDYGGNGKGGVPLGLVIKDHEVVAGDEDDKVTVIGFDDEHHLIVGLMSGKEAVEKGVKEAVSFGPVYMVNGKAAEIAGTGGGLNPRTAIGQREDGAILLLVIDGRQPQSLGASFKDCLDIMIEYGAVNAANLDGGSSSVMVYKNKVLNNTVSLYGSRDVPTAIIVK